MKKECIAFNIIALGYAFSEAFSVALTRAVKFLVLVVVVALFSASSAYASTYNLLDIGADIIRSKLLLKPYVTVGYHSSIPVNVSQTCENNGSSVNCSSFLQHERQRFFEDIASFKNFQLGVGLRINQYFGFEVSYDSFQKEASIISPITGAYSTSSMLASGQWVNVMLMMYSPPIDVKIGTLEFSLGAGIAVPFAFKAGITQQSDGSIPSYIVSKETMGSTPSFSAMAGVTFGLKQPISFTLYTQFLSFNQSANSSYEYGSPTVTATYDISSPFMMTAGIKVNIFVL